MGGGNVERGLGDRNARFGPTDEFGRLVRCVRQNQGHRIGQTRVAAATAGLGQAILDEAQRA